MTAADRQKNTRKARTSAGLCISCGEQSRPGKTKCVTCKDNDTARRRKSYAGKKARNECFACTKQRDGDTIYCIEHRATYNTNAIKYWHQLKTDAYIAYGGMCKCCGEQEPMFLSIDHVDNTGATHRKIIGKGSQIYKWLRDNNYPTGFQILCMNCNLGKSRNGGVCPHSVHTKLTLVS